MLRWMRGDMKMKVRAQSKICFAILILLFLLCSACTALGPNAGNTETNLVQEIWNSLYPRYGDVNRLFTGSGLELSEISIWENDSLYYLVVDPQYQSIQDIRNAVEDVFTEEYAEETFYFWAFEEEERPFFKEIGGKLYQLGADTPWGYPLDEESIEIIRANEDEIIFKVNMIDPMEDPIAQITLKADEPGIWKIDRVETGQ